VIKGNFRFERIQKGDYLLKIYTADKNNKIEIEPDTYKFTVEDKPVTVENPFIVIYKTSHSLNLYSIGKKILSFRQSCRPRRQWT